MAKIKARVWQGRTFLNPTDKSCTQHVSWRVEVHAAYTDKDKAVWSAEFNGSRHPGFYATRKGDLRPMQILQREMNKFNDAVEEAIQMAKDHNAQSKDTA